MAKLPSETERELITKKDSATDPAQGKYPEQRTIEELFENGVICLNKPEGPTSHQTAEYVKEIFKLKKVGHGGTLDPIVTGVLPLALNNATKVLQTLLKGGKEYVCLMHIHKKTDEKAIAECFKEFRGTITQLPPIRSAVKREERQRDIYYTKILEIQDQNVLFQIGCQAGTYIRKLVHDLGKHLDTNAHMVQLIRTKAGPFSENDWHSLYELKDAYELYKNGDEKQLRKIIKPVEFAVTHIPKIYIMDSAVDAICHGAKLTMPGIAKLESGIEPEQLVAILTLKGELIALGKSLTTAKKMLDEQKGYAVQPIRILMKEGTYRKHTKTLN